ncbi:hypothetical protein EV195_105178 [Tenacibaculum skagerrakense]|uniref:BZIP transcription factor n=1 Tax=Tenacibaculum skagerrakense TaxID=186571 RepID=A0A4R2NSD0_9FLAO|nr:hypothetical protein [Tenacibaculum skagerrakense]TCP24747.1 hypothetical protein EV195_105178 [Tenacibaculum skagerrakense]
MKTKIAMIVLLGLSFAVKAQITEASNGNVGIGTTSPSQKLEVKSSGDDSSFIHINTAALDKVSGIRFQEAGQNNWGFLSNYPNDSKFMLYNYNDSANQYAFTLDKNSNIGIGTYSPLAKLDVRGIAQLGSEQGTRGGVFLAQNYAGNDYITTMSSNYSTGGLVIGYGAAGRSGQGNNQLVSTLDNFSAYRGALRFGKGTLEFLSTTSAVQTTVGDVLTTASRFFIKEDGNIGIGTNSPEAKLQINNSSTMGWSSLKNASILLGTSSAGIGIDPNEIMAKNQNLHFGTSTNHHVYFRSGGAINRMVLRGDNGNIGIGTLEPSERLEVVGNIKAQNLILTSTASFYSSESGKTSRRMTINTMDGDNMYLYNYDQDATTFHTMNFGGGHNLNSGVTVLGNGNVGIGTGDTKGYNLAVAGSTGIVAEKVTVKLQSTWPDYVFANDYQLPTLEEVEKQIKENGHLANIPSAKEVEENGVELGDMNKKLLEKVEELTLYTIQQEKEIKKLKEENKQLKSLEERLEKLEALLQKK